MVAYPHKGRGIDRREPGRGRRASARGLRLGDSSSTGGGCRRRDDVPERGDVRRWPRSTCVPSRARSPLYQFQI